MKFKEQGLIILILVLIVVMVSVDLVTDFAEGGQWWHLATEAVIAFVALLGIFLLLRGSLSLRRSLEVERERSLRLKMEAEKWKVESKRFVDGLSLTIDQQLTDWKLTPSEKEVAFLLLKGMSLKEIAQIRQTSEKTARAHSIAVYAKAGLAGRSELAAFFLEDLLPPS